MHLAILLSILLAAKFTTAIPITPQFPPLEQEGLPDELGAVMEAANNENQVQNAANLANQRMPMMEHLLADPEKPRHKEYIEAAFGPNPNIPGIRQNLAALQGPNAVVPIKSRIPTEDGVAWSNPRVDAQGKEIIDPATNRVSYENIELGNEYLAGGMTSEDQASKLMHESVHVLAGGEDDVVLPGRGQNGNAGLEFYQIPTHGHLSESDRIKEAGYTFVADENNPGRTRAVRHAEILENGPGAMASSRLFPVVRDRASGTEHNPDSFSYLSSLAVKHNRDDLCTRSLYKRALTKDDPVGYYLAKRQQCTLPPKYLAKLSAAKNAAAKTAATRSTTNSARTANAAKSRTAQRTKMTPSRKSRKGRKALRAQKARESAMSAARGRRASRAAKTSRRKSTNRSKSSKAARTSRTATPSRRARKAAAAKSRKLAGARKATQAANAARVVKGRQARKTAKAARKTKGVAKANQRTAAAKARKLAGARKATQAARTRKVANARKARKEVKAARKAKGVAKANQRAAAVKAQKLAAARKATQAAKARRVVKGRQARKEAKVARKAKGVAKANARARTQPHGKAANNPTTSNQSPRRGNNSRSSKAAANPRVQQRPAQVQKTRGKRN